MKNVLPVAIENHTFLPGLFGPVPIVLDFGLHDGSFAMEVIHRFGAKVFGAEPASKPFGSIPSHAMLKAENVAIGGRDGTARLELFTERCASLYSEAKDLSDGAEVVTVWSFRTFLERHNIEAVDLLKLDIEGAECDLLEAASDSDLARCGQITIEFHDFMIPSLGARVEAVKSRLAASGFHRINFSLNNGDGLFVRRDLLSSTSVSVLRGPYKHLMGAARRVHRLLRIT